MSVTRARAILFAAAALAGIAPACSSPNGDAGEPLSGGSMNGSDAATEGSVGLLDAGTGEGATRASDAGDASPTEAGTCTTDAPEAPFFSTATIENAESLDVAGSNGDLWASCWSSDDALYAANGDGWGFDATGQQSADVVVNRISGSPLDPAPAITGQALARGASVSSVWTPAGSQTYNRKPTGMLCTGGALYLAVQDLATDFDDAPAATITKSIDGGNTWTWNTAAPMFDNHVFTTIFFADFGKDGAHAFDGYAYAYGLDGNWRFSARVTDPVDLYLARVPLAAVQDRSQWQFFAGLDPSGQPTWASDIASRAAVLHDTTRIYTHPLNASLSPQNMSVLSQGSVLYDAPLDRYVFTSWTEYTFEFYEAPKPWGPWRKFLSKDFGVYPWFPGKNGGYATVAPSKFASADGKTLWVQSNTFVGGVSNYQFSLRKLVVEPAKPSCPTNAKSAANLATTSTGAVPIQVSSHYGNTAYLNDGVVGNESEDSWNGDTKPLDWWGYVWPQRMNVNAVVYTTGAAFTDGGWFQSVGVQVRRDGAWLDVTGLQVSPAAPTSTAAAHTTYTFTFDDTWGDGVRIVGPPGGPSSFTTISELAVYYR